MRGALITPCDCAKMWGNSMPSLDSNLQAQIQANPAATYHVIVRVQGDMDARQTQLEQNGFSITRRLRLIRGFAATAQGANLNTISAQDWIVSIEPDLQVHTMHK